MPDNLNRGSTDSLGEYVLIRAPLCTAIKILALLFFTLSFAGCSRLSPYFHVAAGNHGFSGGDYQKANIAYINAGKNGTHEHMIAYNLGTVYYALGEVAAAEREWQIALGSQDEVLAYKVNFNYGVLLFERGLYEEAYEKFRNALEIRPEGVESKINLELCVERMSAQGSEISREAGRAEDSGGEIDRIMKYLKRIEGKVWESTEKVDYEPLPRDL